MKASSWIVFGALLAALAVAAGAFAAHGLEEKLETLGFERLETPQRVENFDTAARYHLYHAVAIILVGLAAARAPSAWLSFAGGCFLLGIIGFSGMLYAWVLTGMTELQWIVPFGGGLFILGWVLMAIGAATGKKEEAKAL